MYLMLQKSQSTVISKELHIQLQIKNITQEKNNVWPLLDQLENHAFFWNKNHAGFQSVKVVSW